MSGGWDGIERTARRRSRDFLRSRSFTLSFTRWICAWGIERKSRYQVIVACSGEHEYGGAKITGASLSGFPSIGRR
jgi:hypothetical protein